MLQNREDYEFLTENALKRIDIKGQPYPVRPQKLVITGEDEAYLRDAMLERKFLIGWSADKYNDAILRITQTVLRANWLYDTISALIQNGSSALYETWIDKDEAENFERRLPKGAAISITGELTYNRPSGVDRAISECSDAIVDAYSQYDKGAKDEFEDLCKDLDEMYEDRYEKVSEAETQRDNAVAQAQSSLVSDLSKIESEHNAALKAISEEYQRAMEDPEADHEAAQKKYDEDLLNENNGYAMDVSARRDKARLEKVKAEDECRKAIWDAECDLYDKAKARYAEYADKVAELVDARDESISNATRARNFAIQQIETSSRYAGYLSVGGTVGGDGIAFSNVLLDIEEARRDITIDRLCLGQYLRKTPLLINKPDYDEERTQYVTSSFVAHAPSSDATMRAYADLERMRCRSATPPTVYRCAYYTTAYDGDKSYYVEHLDDTYDYPFNVGGGIIEDKYISDRDYSLTFSNTEFAVYYGRKDELPLIDAIYVTVMIARGEAAHDGQEDKTTSNRTVGFLRIRLDKGSIQCESDLADIDKVRKDLADTIASHVETRDNAYKAADDAYNIAYEAAQKAYDKAVDEAKAVQDDAKDAAHRKFMASMEATEKAFNTTVAKIEENDELSDAEKARRIKEAESRYNSKYNSAHGAELEATQAAEREYNNAVNAAYRSRNDSVAKARQDRSEAHSKADEAYYSSIDGLAEEAEEEIAEIKKRPSQRRRAAGNAYASAIDAATRKRDNAISEASQAYEEAREEADEAYQRAIDQGVPRDEAYEAWAKAIVAAGEDYTNARTSAYDEYTQARNSAVQAYWQAYAAIEDIREDARCKWTFTPSPVDAAALSLPGGKGSTYSSDVWMAGIMHFDVVYTPKSLTGADFSAYYAELDEEGATGPITP